MIKKIIFSLCLVVAIFSGISISAKPVSAIGCSSNSINSFTVSPTSGKVGDTVTISWDVKPGCQDGVLEIAPGNIVVAQQPSGSYTHVLTGPPETYYLSVCDGTVPGNGFGKCGVPYYNSGMVADDFAQVTVGASLQPAALTVFVVDQNNTPLSGASWDVFGGTQSPSPSSGSGTSVTHTIYPANGGSTFTVGNISGISGRTLNVTNSDSGGASILVAPGQSKWVKLTYTSIPNPDCTISLNANTNSIINGNSATLTWSSTNTVSPYTTGTNFNTANAQANTIGVTVTPTITTTYTIIGYGGTGCSASQTITVTNPLPTINSFSATQGCVATTPKFDLNWSGTNVTSYTVQRDNSGGTTIYSGSGTSYSDTGRTAGQTYTYYLVATGPGGSVNQTVTSSSAPNCTVPQPPSISTFTATPSCNGTTPEMQLAWSATNGPTNYTVKRNNSSGATIYSGLSTSYNDGSLTPSTSYTYYLEVANGTAPNATQTVSATTGSCVGQAPTVSLTPAPGTVSSGGGSNMNWTVGGGTATSCTVSANPGNGQWSGGLSAGEITAGGHVRTISNITVSTTFSITCSNASGSNSASGAVTVSAAGTPVVTISASPTTVSSGNSSNLTWSVTNSPTSCTASGGWSGTQASSGTNVSTGPLFGNTTFTLTCSNSSGAGSNSAGVTVTGGGLPDLTAGAPITNTAMAGAQTNLSAPAMNTTPNPTGSGYYTMQVSNASNGLGTLTQTGYEPFASLPANYSGTFTIHNYVFPTVGPYSIRLCVDAITVTGPTPTIGGGQVNESDENNNCGPWGNVTVNTGTMDVFAGPTYTTTWASVNSPQSWWYFGAYVKNQGTGSTPGSGFPNLGQLATQPNGGGTITNFNYQFSTSFAPGQQYGTSFANGYTFSTPGTYSTRVCADATGVSGNNATGGVLSETDEANNCGPWTDLVVTLNPPNTSTINVYSNRVSSWDVIGNPTITPASGSGTQTTHTITPASFSSYSLANIQNLSGYTYSVFPSQTQMVYAGGATSYWINYVSTGSFDYSLSNNGTISVTKSSIPVNVQSTITKTLVSGSTQSVDVTATGMPSGVSLAYANRTCSPTCSSTITFTVDPTAPAGTYPITVTANTSGLADKTTTFNLTINNPATLSVTCTPSPSPAYVGQPVTWTGTIVGGTPPYTYAWTGSDFGTGITNPFVFTYQSTGTKSATLTATDSLAVSGSCPATNLGVTIDPKYKEF